MAANDFLTFAAAPGANVLSQALYAELAAQATGFPQGVLKSVDLNKALRQAAMMASAIAQLTSDTLDADVLDNGNRAALISQLEEMIGIVALEYLGAPVVFKGTWNATTNTPALASGVGTAGWMYTVSVAGNTNLDGFDVWNVGDKAVFNGATWERIEGDATEVLSVAGRVGAVVLTVADVGVASQAEAEAGLVNDKAMTPLRTAEAIAALSPGGGGPVILGPAQVELLQGGTGNYTLSHPSLVGADFAQLAIGFALSLVAANEGARGSATVGFFPDDTFNIGQRIDLVSMEWTALNNGPTLIPLQDNLVWVHVLAPVVDGEIFVSATFAQNGITGSNPFFYIGRGVPAPS